MSRAALVLHFRSEETLRSLERAAEALGVSADEFAEAAIERELAAMGAHLESRLTRALEGLKSYNPNLDRDLEQLAQSEVDFEDPLRSHFVEPDAYGIGALFGHSLERG